MSWVGLWEPGGGSYCPGGLAAPSQTLADGNAILPCGTLLLQAALSPGPGDQVLLDYAAQSPWPSGMRIWVNPAGVVGLRHWAGDRLIEVSLATHHAGRAWQVIVHYAWNGPARLAVLSVEIGDTATMVFTAFAAPLPLAMRDGVRLMSDPALTRFCDSTVFVAIADHILPIGPLPSLSGQTLLATPGGLRPMAQLARGDLLTLADGAQAQIRWIGALDLPARGRFAPVTLLAPHYGATRDLVCGRDQRLHLSGAHVDYLFATPVVACQIGDLTNGVHPLHPPPGAVMRYWQVLLDRPATLRSGGLDIEPLDISRLASVPKLRDHSVLASLPDELWPNGPLSDVPVLHGYETRTLCNLRAA